MFLPKPAIKELILDTYFHRSFLFINLSGAHCFLLTLAAIQKVCTTLSAIFTPALIGVIFGSRR